MMQISSVLKSLCSNCNCNLLIPREESLPNLCKSCNVIICDNCYPVATCLKCKKMVCSMHSIRCHICNKRSCKEKGCIVDFHICQACQQTFCQEHFDSHKKFNQQEPFKLKCNSEKCRISQGLGPQGVEELCKCLIHMSGIKELRLRQLITRKQRNGRRRRQSTRICHPITSEFRSSLFVFISKQIKTTSLTRVRLISRKELTKYSIYQY
jgi:hypothetical protein